MLKRTMILLMCCCLITYSLFAAPGDVLEGKMHAIWRVASYKNGAFPLGILAYMLTQMATLPQAYLANADIQEWVGWLRITLVQAFPTQVFPVEVYNTIVYAVEWYQYGTPQIYAARKAPTCTIGTGTITCAQDPTGNERELTLWRYNPPGQTDKFVEQDLTALGISLALVGENWVFSGVPSGVANVCVAYDDGFQSFPTLFFTTQ